MVPWCSLTSSCSRSTGGGVVQILAGPRGMRYQGNNFETAQRIVASARA